MTMTQMHDDCIVGEIRLMRMDGRFWMPVRVLDGRWSYGLPQMQVEPVGGSGRAGVSQERIGRKLSDAPFATGE